ncbi:MotA/TolQ/ExbB proton channel family protein [Paraglaciecola sp.]|uniref:MotA/TolQ/ExbB proton channel family protein n=1 Tax=Paraglaciecola sp. TaxID=1920173 RepID=UPI0030F47CCB
MIAQLMNNWVCWAILLLAVFCYQQLWQQYLLGVLGQTEQQADISRQFSGVLIGALPLLGLLGTIIGLLDCFAGIATEGASGAVLSGGISDALLTTQLGLVCALPAWILQAAIRAKMTRQHILILAR